MTTLGRIHARLRPPKGQITADSGIGRWIELLAATDDVETVVEIGTWRGDGSTSCIVRGFSRRPSGPGFALCLEVHEQMALEAGRRHRHSAGVQVTWGSIVSQDDLDLEGLSDVEREWASQDIDALRVAPNVLDRLPTAIDLLILDGGEFSTYAEFRNREPRVRQWIILDDTKTRKCRRILDEISRPEFESWIPVWSSGERNGVAVLRRDPRGGR